MAAHIHAELMALYAQDALETDKPWERWQFRNDKSHPWTNCISYVAFCEASQYRRKQKTILINGIEVPEPFRGILESGKKYWCPNLIYEDGADWFYFVQSEDYQNLFNNGLIHLTKENALIHAKALLSFTKQ